jgi:probable rRNA maturation factor
MTEPGPRVLVDHDAYPDAPLDLIEAAVLRALRAEGRDDAEISVALLPDAEMRALNRAFLGTDHITDVLAFTLSSEDEPLVGDVYLGYEQAARQAAEMDVALHEELARLAIHGALHALGYDHPEGPERVDCRMFEVQERLLAELMSGADRG